VGVTHRSKNESSKETCVKKVASRATRSAETSVDFQQTAWVITQKRELFITTGVKTPTPDLDVFQEMKWKESMGQFPYSRIRNQP
jgi:hypothetical protein